MSNFCTITTNGKTIKCSGNNITVVDVDYNGFLLINKNVDKIFKKVVDK